MVPVRYLETSVIYRALMAGLLAAILIVLVVIAVRMPEPTDYAAELKGMRTEVGCWLAYLSYEADIQGEDLRWVERAVRGDARRLPTDYPLALLPDCFGILP